MALLRRLLWAAALVLPAFGAQAAVVLTTLHSFHGFDIGIYPSAVLVQGSDGNFYGTTQDGGTNEGGTVFKISTNGALTSLYSFTNGIDGANPYAGLVQGSDGYFYSTTYTGGTYNNGTVFKISANGVLTTLYAFGAVTNAFGYGLDGASPAAGLVQGSDGNFYGTTEYGGPNDPPYGAGTVFKISTNGAFASLYSFTGGNDGARPSASLVQGTDGYFYGTTSSGGGTNNAGTVFKISSNGALTNLYLFTGGNDGGNPNGLVQGSDGYFYGTTSTGGSTNYNAESGTYGYGTVFRISSNGVLTSLYSFTGGNDGAYPAAGLVQGSDGYFYGTTSSMYQFWHGYGTVFRITTTGALTSLYSFTDGNDGGNPNGLVQGSDGNFYGTTYYGGTNGWGTVFRISTNGALTSLYSFTEFNDGVGPQGCLVQGSDGYFYGTTVYGGAGAGTVFRISTHGALTILHDFGTVTNTSGEVLDGATPYAGLVQGSDGNFYGTTGGGGTNGGYGSVFRISTNGVLTSLYSFTGGTDGAYPQAGLVQGSDGNFYGTTCGFDQNGDVSGYGTVFKVSTNGVLTSLYSFSGGDDGAYPQAALTQGSDGNFYGTTSQGGRYGDAYSTYGTVFKISPNGALTTLYSFTGGNDGANPVAGLVQGSDGNFYGTTDGQWEPWGQYPGTLFKISTKGALTSLYSFTGGNDGANPAAGLVQGSDGYFYGTTEYGGYGFGTVFKISTNGVLSTLYAFGRVTPYGEWQGGAMPQAGLVQGSDGNFYGTTYYTGSYANNTWPPSFFLGGSGTVFRLTIVPEFQAVTLTNNMLSLSWSTEAGGTYQLQYNSDLSSSNWTNLNSPFTATGATLSTTDSVTNGPQRFYRLVLLP